jgi:hypothetical protein
MWEKYLFNQEAVAANVKPSNGLEEYSLFASPPALKASQLKPNDQTVKAQVEKVHHDERAYRKVDLCF